MVESQGEAKRFFAERVVHQASAEGIHLSDAERRMLSWSESDPDFEVDPELVAALSAQVSNEEYESKVSRLLRRALQADVGADPQALTQWRQAFAVLAQGDHYISVMIEMAIGSHILGKARRGK